LELKHYLTILARRWMFVVTVPAIVALVIMYQMLTAEAGYTASASLAVTRAPQQEGIDDFRFNEYYLYLASEFAVDDLVEVVRGNVFALDVSETLSEDFGVEVSPGEIQRSIESNRQHRILTLDVQSHDPDRAVLIAQGAAHRLQHDAARYFGFDNEQRGVVVSAVQLPEGAASSQNRDRMIWLLQFLVAGFAGVLLAFLYDYFDDTLHSEEMVREALDTDVLASIPAGRRW
jgi:capsular polysaccharide biosynthesis protein